MEEHEELLIILLQIKNLKIFDFQAVRGFESHKEATIQLMI